MDIIIKKFWDRYFEADELERHKIVQELTGIDKINASLMQSYFDDLENYFKPLTTNIKA